MKAKRVKPACIGAFFNNVGCEQCGHYQSCKNLKETGKMRRSYGGRSVGYAVRKHPIETDERLNEVLKQEVQEVRGSIVSQAEKNELPSRFNVIPCEGSPSMVIHDTHTGRKVTVPIFAYGEVRKAIKALFDI